MTTMHRHHIIPRHMGGIDDPSNIQVLTIADHAEAHRKLYEQHGFWQDKLAWLGLSGAISKQEAARIARSEAQKLRWARPGERDKQAAYRRKIGLSNKGKKLHRTIEHNEK